MRRRRCVGLVAAAAVLGAAGSAAPQATAPSPGRGPSHTLRLAAPQAALFAARLARASEPRWWGGRYPTSAGVEVSVLVSAGYPKDEAFARRWAEQFASFLHGDELTLAQVNVATPEEVEELCGRGALGCYGADRIVVPGEDVDGIAATEVAAHEYGHHVAAHRANPPWHALDWGPKRWATAASVCSRTAAGLLFPGDQGDRYGLNPGEGFAEAYRLLHDRRTDPTAMSWQLVSSSLFPTAEALAAVEADVLRPWAEPKPVVRRHRFTQGARVWTSTLSTPLDGTVKVTLDVPPATPYKLELVDARGRVLARGAWSSGTRQATTATVCGTRSLSVRVVRQGPPARVVLSTRIP